MPIDFDYFVENLCLSRLILGFEDRCFFFFFSVFPDDAIQNIVLEAPWFKSSKRLCAYISCAALREVDTSKMLSAILDNTGRGTCLFLILPMTVFK